jgi:hypothetical protein
MLLYVHIACETIGRLSISMTYQKINQPLRTNPRLQWRPEMKFHKISEFVQSCVSHEVHMHDTVAKELVGRKFGPCLKITRATTLRSAVDI